MDRDDFSFYISLTVTVGALFFGGYYLGRKLEERKWKVLIPEMMENLCRECAGQETRPDGLPQS